MHSLSGIIIQRQASLVSSLAGLSTLLAYKLTGPLGEKPLASPDGLDAAKVSCYIIIASCCVATVRSGYLQVLTAENEQIVVRVEKAV